MADSMQLLSFESTSHRVLYRYWFSFADFTPVDSGTVSSESQKAFYDIYRTIVQGLTENPAALSLSTVLPDKWLGAHVTLNMHPDIYKVRNER